MLSAFMLIVTLLVLYLLRKLQYQSQRDIENNILQVQLKEREYQLEQMQESMDQVQAVRHDMKNFLLSYQILLREGKVQEVQDDIAKMLGERLYTIELSNPSHKMIEALLQYKKALANKNQISMDTRVIMNLKDNNLELLVALSNVIDNAIEAELNNPVNARTISIHINQFRESLSILVKNHITSSVLADNPHLTSTKKDSKPHGIGLKNVRKIVESQDGLLDFFEENEMFCVHIYIP
jgi:sensor histidine kinase regulating citrate/malate metabolism